MGVSRCPPASDSTRKRARKARCLWYEVSLCIKTGEICWVNGGYPSGEKNDNVIFQDALVDELEEGVQPLALGAHVHERLPKQRDQDVHPPGGRRPPNDVEIFFENRKKEDTDNDCLLSIDGTYIRIALPTCKRFYSKKSKKSALSVVRG